MIESTHFESLYPTESRKNEIKQILDFVSKGNSCQLVSLPGVGRSNLLGLLSYNRNVRITYFGENQKWFHFVLVNFAEVKGKTLSDVIKFLFLSLADSLRDRKLITEHDKLHQIFKQHYDFKDELVLFQGLKEAVTLLAIEKELTVVFLFDRFEEYVPMLTSDFFSQLRILRNIAKYRFSVVFSLNRPLEDILEPSLFADFYEFLEGNIVYLPITDEEGLKFRISYVEKLAKKSLPDTLAKHILTITSGHGKLTRLAVEETLTEDEKSLPKTEKELTQFFLEKKSIQKSLLEIWDSLIPSEQNFLTTTCHLYEPEALQSRGPELALALSSGRRVSGSPSREGDSDLHQNDNEKNFLENIGLIKSGVIQIPLFKDFINQQQTAQTTQPITLNPQTNTISKNNQILSDRLTAAEYKLLIFLLQNKNRIVERNEIIDAVWASAKSTAGVTDQAVDQLVSRLRKKIEDNPNNPTHIQTVKGRGLQFTP